MSNCKRCEVLEKRLSQASGALNDIMTLLTSCVMKGDDATKLESVISACHRRILESTDRPRKRPSWFRHTWEKTDWEDYDDHLIGAAGSDGSAKNVATRLFEESMEDESGDET